MKQPTDEAAKAENYLQMASRAIDSGNPGEGEKYCDLALAIDPKDYVVWLLKAKAVARQTSDGRFTEAARCLISGVECAPEEQKNATVQMTSKMMVELCIAAITACCDNIAKFEKNAISSLGERIQEIGAITQEYAANDAVNSFIRSSPGETLKVDTLAALLWLKNVGGETARIVIARTATDIWSKAWEDYQGDEGKPGDEAGRNFLVRSDSIRRLLQTILGIANSAKDKIQAYKTLVIVSEARRDYQSWQKREGFLGVKWSKSKSINDAEKQKLQTEIDVYQREIAKLEGALKSK
jgi:hypothetical protein